MASRASNNNDLPELFKAKRWDELAERLRLTCRQREVARLLCRGMKKEAIAARLAISPETVRMHARALYSKLAVSDRVGLVVRLVLEERRSNARSASNRNPT